VGVGSGVGKQQLHVSLPSVIITLSLLR
jgi:hypothetical protein